MYSIFKSKKILKKFVYLFALSLVIIMLIFSFLITFLVNNEYNNNLTIIIENDATHINLKIEEITLKLINLQNDIIILSNSHDLSNYIENSSNDNLQDLINQFFLFSYVKGYYNQIRYIASSGMEKIRINNYNNLSEVVSNQNLQNKSHRPYFQETIKLNKNEIYIMEFDLNIENNSVEIPYNPTIRLATPIFSSNNSKVGILVLNYKGNFLLDSLKKNYIENSEDNFILINSGGYFLKSENKSEEWGFMPGFDNSSFDKKYSNFWEEIISKKNGSVIRNEGLIVYTSFNPLLTNHNSKIINIQESSYNWMVISLTSRKTLNTIQSSLTFEIIDISMPFFVLFVLISIYSSYFFAQKIVNTSEMRAKEKEQTNQIKITNNLLKRQKEELSEFAHSMNHDLKNSFSVLSQYIDLFEMNENKNECLTSVKKQIVKIKIFLEHSLKLAESGQIIANKVKINLLKLFQEYNQSYNSKINIILDSPTNWPLVLGDRQKIDQIFSNIIDNAIFHGKANEINIKLEKVSSDGAIEIFISNNGLSIDNGIRDKLFRKGVTTKDSSKSVQSGFGLYIVQKISTSHGWTLNLEDHKNVTFVLKIPKSDVIHLK